jgi:hypothetical protein
LKDNLLFRTDAKHARLSTALVNPEFELISPTVEQAMKFEMLITPENGQADRPDYSAERPRAGG